MQRLSGADTRRSGSRVSTPSPGPASPPPTAFSAGGAAAARGAASSTLGCGFAHETSGVSFVLRSSSGLPQACYMQPPLAALGTRHIRRCLEEFRTTLLLARARDSESVSSSYDGGDRQWGLSATPMTTQEEGGSAGCKYGEATWLTLRLLRQEQARLARHRQRIRDGKVSADGKPGRGSGSSGSVATAAVSGFFLSDSEEETSSESSATSSSSGAGDQAGGGDPLTRNDTVAPAAVESGAQRLYHHHRRRKQPSVESQLLTLFRRDANRRHRQQCRQMLRQRREELDAENDEDENEEEEKRYTNTGWQGLEERKQGGKGGEGNRRKSVEAAQRRGREMGEEEEEEGAAGEAVSPHPSPVTAVADGDAEAEADPPVPGAQPPLSEGLRYQPLLHDMDLLSRHLLVPLDALRHHHQWLFVNEDVTLTLQDALYHRRVVLHSQQQYQQGHAYHHHSASQGAAMADGKGRSASGRGAASSGAEIAASFPLASLEQMWDELWNLLGAAWRQRERLWGFYRYLSGPKSRPPFLLTCEAAPQAVPPSPHASPFYVDKYERFVVRRYRQQQAAAAAQHGPPPVHSRRDDTAVASDVDEDSCSFGPFTPERLAITPRRHLALRDPLTSVWRTLRVQAPPGGRDTAFAFDVQTHPYRYATTLGSGTGTAHSATTSPAAAHLSTSPSWTSTTAAAAATATPPGTVPTAPAARPPHGQAHPSVYGAAPRVVGGGGGEGDATVGTAAAAAAAGDGAFFDVSMNDLTEAERVPYLSPECFVDLCRRRRLQQRRAAPQGVTSSSPAAAAASSSSSSSMPVVAHRFSDDAWNAAVVFLEAALCDFDPATCLVMPTLTESTASSSATLTAPHDPSHHPQQQQQQQASSAGGTRTASVFADIATALVEHYGQPVEAAQNYLYAALHHFGQLVEASAGGSTTTPAAADVGTNVTRGRGPATASRPPPSPLRMSQAWLSHLDTIYGEQFVGGTLLEVVSTGLRWRRAERWRAFCVAHDRSVDRETHSTTVGNANGGTHAPHRSFAGGSNTSPPESSSLNNNTNAPGGGGGKEELQATEAWGGGTRSSPGAAPFTITTSRVGATMDGSGSGMPWKVKWPVSAFGPGDRLPSGGGSGGGLRSPRLPHAVSSSISLDGLATNASSLENSFAILHSPQRGIGTSASPGQSHHAASMKAALRMERALDRLQVPLLPLVPCTSTAPLHHVTAMGTARGGGDFVGNASSMATSTTAAMSSTVFNRVSGTAMNMQRVGGGGAGGGGHATRREATRFTSSPSTSASGTVSPLPAMLSEPTTTVHIGEVWSQLRRWRRRIERASGVETGVQGSAEAKESITFTELVRLVRQGLLQEHVGNVNTCGGDGGGGYTSGAVPLLADRTGRGSVPPPPPPPSSSTSSTSTDKGWWRYLVASHPLIRGVIERSQLPVYAALAGVAAVAEGGGGAPQTGSAQREENKEGSGGDVVVGVGRALPLPTPSAFLLLGTLLQQIGTPHVDRSAAAATRWPRSGSSTANGTLSKSSIGGGSGPSMLLTLVGDGKQPFLVRGGHRHAASSGAVQRPTTISAQVQTALSRVDVHVETHLREVNALRQVLIRLYSTPGTTPEAAAAALRRHLRCVPCSNGFDSSAHEPVLLNVPPILRGEVWGVLLHVPPSKKRESLVHGLNTTLGTLSDRQVALDLPRCHAYHPLLASEEGRERLRRVLKGWLRLHPEQSYWQGLDSIAAVLLSVSFTDEALVTMLLDQLVHRFIAHDGEDGGAGGEGAANKQASAIPSSKRRTMTAAATTTPLAGSLHHQQYRGAPITAALASAGQLPSRLAQRPLMEDQLRQFTVLLRYCDPLLAVHLFETVGCTASLFAMGWLLTLFSHGMPTRKVSLVWDFLFTYSHDYPHCLPCLCCAMAMQRRQELLGHDFSACLAVLTSVAGSVNVLSVLKDTLFLLHAVPPCIGCQPYTEDNDRWDGVLRQSEVAFLSVDSLVQAMHEGEEEKMVKAAGGNQAIRIPSASSTAAGSVAGTSSPCQHWSDTGLYLVDLRSASSRSLRSVPVTGAAATSGGSGGRRQGRRTPPPPPPPRPHSSPALCRRERLLGALRFSLAPPQRATAAGLAAAPVFGEDARRTPPRRAGGENGQRQQQQQQEEASMEENEASEEGFTSPSQDPQSRASLQFTRRVQDAAGELLRQLRNPAMAAVPLRQLLDGAGMDGPDTEGERVGAALWRGDGAAHAEAAHRRSRSPHSAEELLARTDVNPLVLKTAQQPHVVLVTDSCGHARRGRSEDGLTPHTRGGVDGVTGEEEDDGSEYGVNEDLAVAQPLALELIRCGVHKVSILLGGFEQIRLEAPQLVVQVQEEA